MDEELRKAMMNALMNNCLTTDQRSTLWVMLAATQPQRDALAAPSDFVLVPVEPTPEMIYAYLKANDAYWQGVDEAPPKIGVWRAGTPREATASGYRAMIAAAPAQPGQAEAQTADLLRQVGRMMVEMTTTVRYQEEWLAIPELWRLCMEERDTAQAQVARLREALADIAAMTYDSWTNGAKAKEIAKRSLAESATTGKDKCYERVNPPKEGL